MAVYNEADFVMQGKEVQDPEIAKDELELYYDVKGKKNGDVHKDKLLDMSGQGKDGELSGFDYDGKLSGYVWGRGLVFDGIEDTLKMPKLSGIDADNFTYQLNNNILAFTRDEVKTVKNGNIEVGGRNLFAISELPALSAMEKVGNELTFMNYYGYGTGIKVGSVLEVGKEYTISFKVKRLSGTASSSIAGSICFYDPLDDSFYRRFGGGGAETISETFVLDSISEDDVIYIYGSSTGVYEFKDIKIEKGSTATPWTPAPEDLIETTDLKGNILGDVEGIVDASPRDIQSSKEVFTEHADDSHVQVEVDGQSYQRLDPNARNMVPTKYGDWLVDYDYNKDDGALEVTSNRMAASWLIEVESNKSYYYDVGNPDIWYVIRTLDSNKTIEDESWGGSGSSGVKTTNSTTKYLGVGIYTISGVILKDEFQAGNIKPIIQDASVTDRSFIEYVPKAPSPDYPVEIESLNDFDVVSSVEKLTEGQLEEYDYGTEYEGVDKINLSLSEPLRSRGSDCDRLIKDSDGLWKIERNIELINPEDGTRTIEETYGVIDIPIYETLPQDYQDQLNTLKSFKDSNYIYTVQNMDNLYKEHLIPTLHATFNSKDYLKETRTLTNLLIWARELTDEELIYHNQLFLNRFKLLSDKELIERTLNLLHRGVVGHSLEQNYTINI